MARSPRRPRPGFPEPMDTQRLILFRGVLLFAADALGGVVQTKEMPGPAVAPRAAAKPQGGADDASARRVTRPGQGGYSVSASAAPGRSGSPGSSAEGQHRLPAWPNIDTRGGDISYPRAAAASNGFGDGTKNHRAPRAEPPLRARLRASLDSGHGLSPNHKDAVVVRRAKTLA